jgi:HTH-type transcriptional regulator, cell division transcriptional repressor
MYCVITTHFIVSFPLKFIHTILLNKGDYMNNRNIIGNRIREFRVNAGITQEDLTARLNVLGVDIDRPMVSKIENCSREIVDYEIKAIAKALKVSIEDLFK